VPQDLDGMVLLEVATPLGSATANVWVSQPPSGAALAACQLGTYEATPGHLVDELYGRRWREPETSAFFRGEYGAGRMWMRVEPQCSGAPPVRPELRLRAPSGSYQLARDCNFSTCIPNQGRAYELRSLGVFQGPQPLDVKVKCSNGAETEYLNSFTLYVPP